MADPAETQDNDVNNFHVEIHEDTPDTAVVGDEIEVIAEITNHGDSTEEQEITAQLAEEENLKSQMLELEPDETKKVYFEFEIKEEYEDNTVTFLVCSEYECDGIYVEVPISLDFAVNINIEASDEKVRQDEFLEVTVEVENEGAKAGEQDVELFIEEIESDYIETVYLDSEENTTIKYSYHIPEDLPIGTYTPIVKSETQSDGYIVEVKRQQKTLNIEINDYSIGNVIVKPQAGNYEEKVVATSSASFEIVKDTSIILEAVPDDNKQFSHWEGDIGSGDQTEPEPDFYLSQDRDIKAVFEAKGTTLHINYEGEGGGLKSHSSGIHEYNMGKTVPIEAEEPDYGWRFVGWKCLIEGLDHEQYVDYPGALDTTIEMAENTVYITAVYEKTMYELTIQVDGEGEIDPFVGTKKYQKGTRVTLAPLPEDGYNFHGWEGPDADDIQVNTIYMDSDKRIIALFTIDTVELKVESTEGGETSPEGRIAVQTNTNVDLVAISEVGYDFVEWQGSNNIVDPQSRSTYIEINEEDEKIEAIFEAGEICIEIKTVGPGTTEPEPAVYCFDVGENIQLTAVAEEEAEFIGWTGPVEDRRSRTTHLDV